MTTQLRESFEKEYPHAKSLSYNQEINKYEFVEENGVKWTHAINREWSAYQKGYQSGYAARQAEIDVVKSSQPYPLFSTEVEEMLLAEIMDIKQRLVSVTDEYLNAEATCAELKRKLEEKLVVDLSNLNLKGSHGNNGYGFDCGVEACKEAIIAAGGSVE